MAVLGPRDDTCSGQAKQNPRAIPADVDGNVDSKKDLPLKNDEQDNMGADTRKHAQT